MRRDNVSEAELIKRGWKRANVPGKPWFWTCPDCGDPFSEKSSGRQKHAENCRVRKMKRREKLVRMPIVS
jgi:hypothetical protein